MKTYYYRIKESKEKGNILYQPQLKRKNLLSFLFNWGPLSMLILNKERQTCHLKFWSENKEDAQEALDRFSFICKVKIEQLTINKKPCN